MSCPGAPVRHLAPPLTYRGRDAANTEGTSLFEAPPAHAGTIFGCNTNTNTNGGKVRLVHLGRAAGDVTIEAWWANV
jgi:hypothetical protein